MNIFTQTYDYLFISVYSICTQIYSKKMNPAFFARLIFSGIVFFYLLVVVGFVGILFDYYHLNLDKKYYFIIPFIILSHFIVDSRFTNKYIEELEKQQLSSINIFHKLIVWVLFFILIFCVYFIMLSAH